MIPLELQNKSLDTVREIAAQKITTTVLRGLEQEKDKKNRAELEADLPSQVAAELNMQAWRDKKTKLLARLEKCISIEEICRLLSRITGYPDKEF